MSVGDAAGCPASCGDAAGAAAAGAVAAGAAMPNGFASVVGDGAFAGGPADGALAWAA